MVGKTTHSRETQKKKITKPETGHKKKGAGTLKNERDTVWTVLKVKSRKQNGQL